MTIRETLIAAITGISLLATTAHAGGPVIVEDEYTVTEPARRDWIVPVLIGGIILCAIACGGDDEPAPVDPGPVCQKGCE